MTRCRTCSQEDRGILLGRKRRSASEKDRCVRRLEARTPQTWHRSVKEKSARPKEYISWCESGRSKYERRNFSGVLEKKCVQRNRAGRYDGVDEDPEISKTEHSGGEGTGMLSPAQFSEDL